MRYNYTAAFICFNLSFLNFNNQEHSALRVLLHVSNNFVIDTKKFLLKKQPPTRLLVARSTLDISVKHILLLFKTKLPCLRMIILFQPGI